MASIKDLKRMCKAYDRCIYCPISDENDNCIIQRVPEGIPDNADEIIDKWVQEHPTKAYAIDFFEKFPNAGKRDDGTPRSCRANIYGEVLNCEGGNCYKCWNEEMKEE